MKTETILGIGALVILIAFIVFAFRQGMKVKPSGSAGGGDPGIQSPPDSPSH